MIRWISAKLRCDFSSEKASSIGREIPKVPINPLKGRPPRVAEGTRESFQRASEGEERFTTGLQIKIAPASSNTR